MILARSISSACGLHLWLCTLTQWYSKGTVPRIVSEPVFANLSFINTARVSAFLSAAIMALQLNAAQHILINALLKEGFDTKLIATEASCNVRAVQRIRLKTTAAPKCPPPREQTRVGRRSSITPPMQKALFNVLIKQPYLYRCEMADFLYRRFRKRISERLIGRTLRSIGWTRITIRRIAQQRDADLRDHYLHRISQYKSDQLVFVDESGCDGRAGHRRWGWSKLI